MSAAHAVAAAALRLIDPETAHGATIAALKAGLGPRARGGTDAVLRATLAGMTLANPVGLAAGFDKNAEVFAPMLRAGFGFIECGTTTPRPQAGNARPRLFRLDEDRAVINRLGFNNDGLAAFAARLRRRVAGEGIVGANVGPNRDSADWTADYVAAATRLCGLADFITLNVSSPNTEGLRALQSGAALAELLAALAEARRGLDANLRSPVFLKIAPDLTAAEIGAIVETAVAGGVAGLIVSNTTLSRPAALRSRNSCEAGGLSGAPLFAIATKALEAAREAADGRLALIGAGGVSSGREAYAKIRAGACAVQLYTGLVFAGPGLVSAILKDLAQRLRADGFASVDEAAGAR